MLSCVVEECRIQCLWSLSHIILTKSQDILASVESIFAIPFQIRILWFLAALGKCYTLKGALWSLLHSVLLTKMHCVCPWGLRNALNPCLLVRSLLCRCLCWHVNAFLDRSPPLVEQWNDWNGLKHRNRCGTGAHTCKRCSILQPYACLTCNRERSVLGQVYWLASRHFRCKCLDTWVTPDSPGPLTKYQLFRTTYSLPISRMCLDGSKHNTRTEYECGKEA